MTKKRIYYLKAILCLLVLFITPLAISLPSLLHNEVPLNLEGLTLRAPWQEARAPGTAVPETHAAHALIERYYPWYVFLNQAGTAGELPLWNPYEGFGFPFLALWRTRAFSPFSLPLYFLPLAQGIIVSIFLKLSIAGLCAYFIARRFQFSPFFALLVAIPFQLSGIFMVSPWHPVADVAPFFPLLLPCLQCLMLGKRRYWPCLALLTGIMTLGGSPEALAAILSFAVALIFIFSLRTYQPGKIPAALFWLAAGSAVGLCLAAVQLAPYLEFLSFGYLENKTDRFFAFRDLTAFLLPPVLSNGAFAEQDAALWLPAGLVGFLLFPVWLALRSFANRVRKRRIEAVLLTAIIVPCLALVAIRGLRALPGLSMLDVSHFLIPLPLAFGLLAATTADEWIHLNAAQCTAALKKLKWLLPLIWFLTFSAAAASLLLYASPGSNLHLLAPLAVCSLALLLLLGVTILWPRASFTALSLCLISFVLLWYLYQPHARSTPVDLMAPETQFTRALSAENARVAGTNQLKRWPLSPHGISQVHSPSGVILYRTETFLTSTEETPELLRLSAASQMLLTKMDVKERFSALRPVLNIREVLPSGAILLKDLQAHPRARIVYSARKRAAGGPPLSLRAAGPPVMEGGTHPPTGDDTLTTEAVVTKSDISSVEIAAESGQPGILILADAWYPGWEAFTNGNQTPILPVDIAFRGVEVGEGAHQVVFKFKPDSLRLGVYVSSGALVLVALGLLALLRAHRAERHS